jgi:Sec-independent protein translocase protein TatA
MDNIFGIGMPELIVILLIAGIVMGPERIGQAARWLGKTTAQLQTISRSFVRQLNNELDGLDDGGALRDAMQEVKTLRDELQTLRRDFISTTNSVTQIDKAIMDDVQNSILPPNLKPVNGENKGGGNTAVPSQTTPLPTPSTSPSGLPSLVNIHDDPE